MATLLSVSDSQVPTTFLDQVMASPVTRPPIGLEAIKYDPKSRTLEVLNQLKLPHEYVYDGVETCEDAFDCIKAMRVRGAPAIAIVAALALVVELFHKNDRATTKVELLAFIDRKLDYLKGSRPTAVDLSKAITLLKNTCRDESNRSITNDELLSCTDIREAYMKTAEKIFADDYDTNIKIGEYGAKYLQRQQQESATSSINTTDKKTKQPYTETDNHKISVLTHCNTGSLATSGHGTALGIIRSLFEMGSLKHVYCTETRPYNQGSRLTAFELQYEKIPCHLITDSMAGALFARMKESMNISAVIVGADRVARNGDTANKIGTYSLAVLANFHKIKFIVAAPTTSIDLETETGDSITIENRPGRELTQITGAVVDAQGNVDTTKTVRVAIADQTIDVWNPSFDVTPHNLIDAIITEKGEVLKNAKGNFNFRSVMPVEWKRIVKTDSEGSGDQTDFIPDTPSTLDGSLLAFKFSPEKAR